MYTIDYTVSRLVGQNSVPLPDEITYADTSITYSKCNALSAATDDYECLETIPYEKNFLLVVEARIADGPIPIWNNNVQFSVLIEDPCVYDQVSIPAATAIQDFTYYLSQNNAPYELSPIVKHKYPECPIYCNLYQDFFGFEIDYPWEIVWEWDPIDPIFVSFLAEDKFLSASSYDLIIRCEIDPRASPDTTENPFTITLIDECYDV